MKKVIFSCIIVMTVFGSQLFAQNINISLDSIQKLLCKNWEVNYAIMGGMKITRKPDASEINYKFNKDQTFFISRNNPKEKKKGTWSYDPKKNLINLTLDGRTNTKIISLKEDEFVMVVDTKNATPDDPMEIKLVYKPGTN